MAQYMIETVLFHPGRCVATPGALHALEAAGATPETYLDRHVCGKWGIVDDEDAQANEDALVCGDRLMSVYKLHTGVTIWVVTEADRSATCLLLPSEY
jgi:hypothetical protein